MYEDLTQQKVFTLIADFARKKNCKRVLIYDSYKLQLGNESKKVVAGDTQVLNWFKQDSCDLRILSGCGIL